MNTNFENLSNTERAIRFAITLAALVVIMESSLAGSMLFAVLFIIGVAFATTAIIGWDPLKSVSLNMKLQRKGASVGHTQKHA